MHSTAATRHFSGTYAEARRKFLEAAEARGARIESFVLEAHRGALGETLATDTAYLGPPGAARLLIVSSGTHGPEGFCGSGCQVATLHDDDLLERMAEAQVGLLLVHAVNRMASRTCTAPTKTTSTSTATTSTSARRRR